MTRTEFYPHQLQYLFSVDLNLESASMRWEVGTSALSTRCSLAEGDATLGAVYHALGEIQVNGRDVVVGSVRVVRERTRFDPENKKGDLKAELVIETTDHMTIHAECSGVFKAPGGRFTLALLEAFPNLAPRPVELEPALEQAVETRAFVSARFDTGAPKYRWLASSQCVGYGRMYVTNGEPLCATFDIYVMQ